MILNVWPSGSLVLVTDKTKKNKPLVEQEPRRAVNYHVFTLIMMSATCKCQTTLSLLFLQLTCMKYMIAFVTCKQVFFFLTEIHKSYSRTKNV